MYRFGRRLRRGASRPRGRSRRNVARPYKTLDFARKKAMDRILHFEVYGTHVSEMHHAATKTLDDVGSGSSAVADRHRDAVGGLSRK
jgi:hypothetical protein